jgi:putative NADH-flavin reductase
MNLIHLSGRLRLALVVLSSVAVPFAQAAESKNIVVYGASGRVGEVIVDVALERGHKVKGVSRHPENLEVRHPNFTAIKGDILDIASIRELAMDADAIVISISAKAKDNTPENSLLVAATKAMQEALSQMETRPYIVQMGGANLMYGSSYKEVKQNMKNAPFDFDEGTSMYAVLFGHQISVDMYRASDLEWTVVVPPMTILGIYRERDNTTTKESYRTSTSAPLVAADGSKTIYVRDLATATVKEIENREFARQLFTVGY